MHYCFKCKFMYIYCALNYILPQINLLDMCNLKCVKYNLRQNIFWDTRYTKNSLYKLILFHFYDNFVLNANICIYILDLICRFTILTIWLEEIGNSLLNCQSNGQINNLISKIVHIVDWQTRTNIYKEFFI